MDSAELIGKYRRLVSDLTPLHDERLDVPCDCDLCKWAERADTRKTAAALCHICNKPIGYGVRFAHDRDGYVHMACAFEQEGGEMAFEVGDTVIRQNDPRVGTVERVYPANPMSAYRSERQDRARVQWSPLRPWVPSSATTSIVRFSDLRSATPENIAAAKAKAATRLANFDKKVAELRRQREQKQAAG